MTNARPRTLADALKRVAALKREVEATRKRLVKDRDGVLAVADSERRAMRTLLDEVVAQRDAHRKYSELREVLLKEADEKIVALECERDEALDALDAVRDVLDATPPESVQGPPGYPEARR